MLAATSAEVIEVPSWAVCLVTFHAERHRLVEVGLEASPRQTVFCPLSLAAHLSVGEGVEKSVVVSNGSTRRSPL